MKTHTHNIKRTRWITTCNRFVAFFDIMGFKDMVMRNSHDYVVKKIRDANRGSKIHIDGILEGWYEKRMETNLRSFQFSDSFFIVSESDRPKDALNMIYQSSHFINSCIRSQIPLKGAISYGLVTADFKNRIFVGQPIIDAYLLHEELELYGAVLDCNAEKKMNEFKDFELYDRKIPSELVRYKVPTKNGETFHQCIGWPHVLYELVRTDGAVPPRKILMLYSKIHVEKFYQTVSGKSRRYIDNTLTFIEYFINRAKEKYPEAETIKYYPAAQDS
jgi:hypothetical protein